MMNGVHFVIQCSFGGKNEHILISFMYFNGFAAGSPTFAEDADRCQHHISAEWPIGRVWSLCQ